ncbi:hypothetical protein BU16DRAFT_186195 [Lophium mytilinum]|uniref:Uncharacterized protein n=1 Tax=Lophium mytilinum TaxID=390894 RepID=A0A6A6R894_9PEZI|nr:hypothetical protein BU16DRAFT_186195 [Lophium mytilinum]
MQSQAPDVQHGLSWCSADVIPACSRSSTGLAEKALGHPSLKVGLSKTVNRMPTERQASCMHPVRHVARVWLLPETKAAFLADFSHQPLETNKETKESAKWRWPKLQGRGHDRQNRCMWCCGLHSGLGQGNGGSLCKSAIYTLQARNVSRLSLFHWSNGPSFGPHCPLHIPTADPSCHSGGEGVMRLQSPLCFG